MSFDPEPYASGLRRRNDRERAQIEERLAQAKIEAQRLARAILAADASVRAVYLFGSVAAGQPKHIDFDIDIALEGGDSYRAMDIVQSSPFDVDIVDLARIPEHVRMRILDSGIRFLPDASTSSASGGR